MECLRRQSICEIYVFSLSAGTEGVCVWGGGGVRGKSTRRSLKTTFSKYKLIPIVTKMYAHIYTEQQPRGEGSHLGYVWRKDCAPKDLYNGSDEGGCKLMASTTHRYW